MKRRLLYASAVAATVALGLASRRPPLHQYVGDAPGDALWAAMVYFALSTLAPVTTRGKRGAAALSIAWTVELLQLWRAPWLVDLRATRLGHLALGSAFTFTDLLAYAVGIVAAVAAERVVVPGSASGGNA